MDGWDVWMAGGFGLLAAACGASLAFLGANLLAVRERASARELFKLQIEADDRRYQDEAKRRMHYEILRPVFDLLDELEKVFFRKALNTQYEGAMNDVHKLAAAMGMSREETQRMIDRQKHEALAGFDLGEAEHSLQQRSIMLSYRIGSQELNEQLVELVGRITRTTPSIETGAALLRFRRSLAAYAAEPLQSKYGDESARGR